MLRLATDSDITLFSRYECKYLVSPMLLPGIREFLQPFMQPDRFAQSREGYRYPVCSLYLDSDDLRLYQQTVGGEKNRFKLRVRTYDDEPDSPVFFEVKRKINTIVSKRRARLSRRAADCVLNGDPHGGNEKLPPQVVDDVDHFTSHVSLTGAKPLVRVKYSREAYESRGGDPVRVTVDTELMHAVTLDNTLLHGPGRWVTTPVPGSIIELKFTERFPEWISGLVQAFGLKQQPVPKYVWSVDHMLMDGREGALAVGGLILPPRRA